jgi:small-conductance mechanosensitive channel
MVVSFMLTASLSRPAAGQAMTAAEMLQRLVLCILTVLVGLASGLLLRHWLVRRLKKTVLDDWLSGTLGLLVVLPPFIGALIGAFNILTDRWDWLPAILHNVNLDIRVIVLKGIGSLLIVVFAIGVARTLSRLTRRSLGEHRLDLNLRLLINRLSFILVMLVAFFWVLSIWQVAIELPVAVLGTLTVAITFSIQEILKDLVAGLYILLEHPFFIGDQISTDRYTGRVVSVELRATRLRLVSGEDVIIPNALVFGSVVINNSRYTERRATITVTLPVEDFQRQETIEQMIACIGQQEGVLPGPEPAVALSGINGTQVELTVRFWVHTGQLATVTDVMYALRTLLPGADLVVKEAAGDV